MIIFFVIFIKTAGFLFWAKVINVLGRSVKNEVSILKHSMIYSNQYLLKT